MLRCELTDIYGQKHVMPRLLSLQVDVDEGVPADALYALFPYTPTAELCEITLYDGDDPVFIGVVDEEEHICDHNGTYLKVSARSLAAHLLDNEAMPCEYDHPSLSMMVERYAKPFGITLDTDSDEVFFGEQSVTKGTSCWKALKNFCIACYLTPPRISSTGVLYPKGLEHSGVTVFGSDGVRYIRLREVKKRCEEISAVHVKATNGGTYSFPIENHAAKERGVSRKRYLNAVLTESPMKCADAMIKNGDSKSYAVYLRCEGCLLGTEGNRAVITDPVLGNTDELYISAVHYRMKDDGAYSNITLKRRTF